MSGLDRPGSGERAVLVYPTFGAPLAADERREFEELSRSAGADCVAALAAVRAQPNPRYLIGGGKVEELRELVAEACADLVLVDYSLSPSQERNLERAVRCRVLDRSGLILDIFAQRARSFEGKLQVELAQLRHLSTRLVRGWTHLERQKGGIGLRGPGETQLETDRRLLAKRIKSLKLRLEKVSRQRDQGRQKRRRASVATVSLMGYTNAGKSTLFNRLTGANAYCADKLFATLDPTLRRLDLPDAVSVVLADTVGFVRELPHELIAAFRATLEETRDAALLLHVIDAGDAQRSVRKEQVEAVLTEIEAQDVPRIEVYNKIDIAAEKARVESDANGHVVRAWVSASTGEGLDELLAAMASRVQPAVFRGDLELGPEHARLRARLFELGAVRRDDASREGGGWTLNISIGRRTLRELCAEAGVEPPPAACASGGEFLQSRAIGA